jgi:DMSO reductase anchor subunit
MTKCTLCRPRLVAGLDPACVEACPLGALRLEQRDEPLHDEPELAGLPAVGALPSLQILHRRRGLQAPPMAPPAEPLQEPPSDPAAAPGHDLIQGLRHEWSLLLFTSLVPWIVAWLLARVVQARPLAPSVDPADPAAGLVLLAAGVLAAAVSSLHLARPWRAVLAARNPGRSWISREVLLFGACIALGSAFLGLGLPALVGWTGVAAGIGCTISIDMVYRSRGQLVTLHPHSAMVSLTAPLLAAALLDLPRVAALALAVKLALYLARKLIHRGTRAVAGPLTSGVRLAAMAAAGSACLAAGSCASPLALVSLLIGEGIDRAELYAELRFPDPPLQLARDLRRVLER